MACVNRKEFIWQAYFRLRKTAKKGIIKHIIREKIPLPKKHFIDRKLYRIIYLIKGLRANDVHLHEKNDVYFGRF